MPASPENTTERFSRCPYCLAVFRVRPEKLAVRQGEVRCGACREVFNATWHFVALDDDGRFVPIKVANSEASSLDLDSDTPDSVDSFSLGEPSTSPSDSVADEIREEIEKFDAEVEAGSVTPEPEDESQLEDKWDVTEEGDTVSPAWKPAWELAAGHDSESSDTRYHRDGPVADAMPDAAQPGDFDLGLRQPDPESGSDKRMNLSPGESSLAELEVTPKPAPGNWFNVDPDSLLEHNPFQGDRTDADSRNDTAKPANINMHGVDAYIEDRPNPLVGLFWFIVSVGFVFLLGLQVRTYFVDRYAQDEQYRPYLSLFCRIASCELPARRDTYRFAITNTRIDLHPDEPGALKITVKLVNQATFAQPYPDLQLTLTDRVGRVVGRRTFAPDFYLAGGSMNLLDSGELGTVEFDLARPHEKAVGFVVDIVRESDA